MDRALPFTLIRLCLGLFALLAMLAGTWAQAASPAPGGATAVVICSHGEEKTVYLDDQGKPVPMQHDCGDCPACNVPAAIDPPLSCHHARPLGLAASAGPILAAGPVLLRPHPRPLSRAPPFPDIHDGHSWPGDRIDPL